MSVVYLIFQLEDWQTRKWGGEVMEVCGLQSSAVKAVDDFNRRNDGFKYHYEAWRVWDGTRMSP